jgi:hypothetical protein
MKLNSILSSALLASVGMAMITTTAHASISAKDDDLILSFRATAGTGDTVNVEYDLGNVDSLTSSFSLNLAPDLSTQFGTPGTNSTWNSNTDLLWSVVGTSYNAPTGSNAQFNLYFTTVTGGTPDAPQSVGNQTPVSGTLNNLTTYLNRKTVTTQNGNGIVVTGASGVTNSYYNLVTNDGSTVSSFSYFNTSVENGVNTAGGPVTANLYEDVPGANSPEELGTFSLSSAGELTYQAIPEPSTYLLMGMGTLALMFWARRRKAIMA